MENIEKLTYPQRPYLIQDLIKEQSFTLLAGSSAAGKSTLIFQNTHSWITNRRFLGFHCHRVPRFWYIAFDRLLMTAHDQLALMGIHFGDAMSLQSFAMIDLSRQSFSMPPCAQGDVIIFEGLDFLVKGGDIKSFQAVAELCRQCVQMIEIMGISIIGIVGGNKPKGRSEESSNPFDRISGSGVWQRITETNMVIEAVPESNQRVLHIRPRFSAELKQTFRMEKGLLLPATDSKVAKSPQGFLTLLPNTQHFGISEAVTIGKANQISESTVYRLIDHMVDEVKTLVKIRPGRYRKSSLPN